MCDIAETRHCKNCSQAFDILTPHLEYYRKIEVPPPSWCPYCRHLRRHGYVNDYVYYTRHCDMCRKRFVAMFPEDSEYRVICQTCWYSEARDDLAEGRAYDLSRGFFEQFNELMHTAPQMGIIAIHSENSEFCESIADCKNTYLISECSNCEDCLYGYWIQKTKDSIDTCYLHECERCYETIDSTGCYRLFYSQNCRQCRDSFFLDSCIACSDCAFCVNLRHKQYHIFNQAYSKEEYFEIIASFQFTRGTQIQKHRREFNKFVREQPRKHLQIENSENSIGDYVRNTKNCYQVYHCYDAEECAFGEHIWRGAKYCMDANTAGRGAELVYECTNTALDAYHCKFCRYCWGCRYTEYSNMCVNSSHLFGCVGLKAHASYRILNRQYREDDYHALLKQIKQRMYASGEYGEFFPLSISLFGYNTTVSFDECPFEKEEVLARGWKWESNQAGTVGKGSIAMEKFPDAIQGVSNSITNEVLTCEVCTRNYRLTQQELKFYIEENIPPPRSCPDCRHRARLSQRNRKLFRSARCTDCQREIPTTLNPAEWSGLLCVECYEKVVY